MHRTVTGAEDATTPPTYLGFPPCHQERPPPSLSLQFGALQHVHFHFVPLLSWSRRVQSIKLLVACRVASHRAGGCATRRREHRNAQRVRSLCEMKSGPA